MSISSTTTSQFRQRATIALNDVGLQGALDGATAKFATARERALAELPAADALRDHFKQIRQATLARLADHLTLFEQQAQANGTYVHWAADGAEACQIVTQIAQSHKVTLATKSKSMATEEIGLNQALLANGIEPVETDLGEWIIQLAQEPPSHIIAPAIHKTRQQVAELFSRTVGHALDADDIPSLTAVARQWLREKFLAAGMGISGGNILVAETGSVVLVTNEGNGRLTTSAPPVHVAVVGLEKIAPTWAETAVWLSLLARSATGQPMSIYTSVISGPRRADDEDGPGEVHVVLLDNGRSDLIGTKYEEILQCIRCGACVNACPVYREAGGHAYGSPYSGPIGAVISPLLFGRQQFGGLPHASSLCGACRDVCPARIDLPRMLVELRADQVTSGQTPWLEGWAERTAARVMADPQKMGLVTKVGRLGQRPFTDSNHIRLPLSQRHWPALAPRSFRELWAEGAE